MKKLIISALLCGVAQAETIYTFRGSLGYDVAASRSDFTSYNLDFAWRDPKSSTEHPDITRYKLLGIPFPQFIPAVVDTDSGIAVPVVETNLDAAVLALGVAVTNSMPDLIAANAEVANILGTNTLAQMRATVIAQIDQQGATKKNMQDLARYLLARDAVVEGETNKAKSDKKARRK